MAYADPADKLEWQRRSRAANRERHNGYAREYYHREKHWRFELLMLWASQAVDEYLAAKKSPDG